MKIIIRKVFIGILLLTTIKNSAAQKDSIYSFTLKEAQEFAINNNLTLKNAALDNIAAKKKVWETTAIGLPQVNGSFDYTYIPGSIPEINFAAGFIPIIDRLESLHPGEFTDIREGMEQAVSPIAVRSSGTYSITVSQLVFSGEYIVGLQAAKTFKQLTANSYDKSVLDIKELVASGYYSIVILEENQRVLDSSIINMEEIIEEMEIMLENGLIEDTELDQLNLTLKNTINASNSLQNQITILYRLLKINLGLDNNNEIKLSESIDNFNNTTQATSLTENEFSLSNNTDYQMLETNEKISALSLKREKAKYLPSVSAFYSYTDKTKRPELDFTLNHMIGIGITVPIFSSGMRNAQVQQAKIEFNKAQNNKHLAGETILMQIEQAKLDLATANEKYNNEKLSIQLSEKIYNKTKIKHKEGIASSMELTEAHNQYLTSYSNYTNALLEVLNAELKLKKLYNDL